MTLLEPDWVFVWPLGFGRVEPTEREVTMNGRRISYRPQVTGTGLLWQRPGATPPLADEPGLRLSSQRGLSRMALFHWGYVTLGWVVVDPEGDIAVSDELRGLADEAFESGLTESWAPAAVGRGDARSGAVVVSTFAAARWIADQHGAHALYRLDGDTDTDLRSLFRGEAGVENLFVCDREEGDDLAGLVAPVTLQRLLCEMPALSEDQRDFDGDDPFVPTQQ